MDCCRFYRSLWLSLSRHTGIQYRFQVKLHCQLLPCQKALNPDQDGGQSISCLDHLPLLMIQRDCLEGFATCSVMPNNSKAMYMCCRYRSLVMEEEDEKLDSMLTSMQTKDELTQKAEATTKLKVQAFQCHTCKNLTERRKPECQGHDVQRVSTTKRWWLCNSCGHHFSTVGVRLPNSHCSRYPSLL